MYNQDEKFNEKGSTNWLRILHIVSLILFSVFLVAGIAYLSLGIKTRIIQEKKVAVTEGSSFADNEEESDNEYIDLEENSDSIAGDEEVLTMIYPQENDNPQIKESRYVITGVAADGVDAIRVEYQHAKSGLSDDYYLTNFNKGDETWEYVADVKYRNLNFGENSYRITAYADNVVLGTKEFIIYFDAKEHVLSQEVSVKWSEDLTLIDSDEKPGVSNYLVGEVSSGEYNGLRLLLNATAGMGGYEFDYYVVKDGIKIFFKDSNIVISDLANLPEELVVPNTSYVLEKGYSPTRLFSDFQIVKTLFNHESLGNFYLAYPIDIYEELEARKGQPAGVKVRGSATYNCVIVELKDHTVQVYNLPVNFVDDKRIPNITFIDGETNTAVYSYTKIVGCGSYCEPLAVVSEENLQPETNLKIAGKTSTGEIIYEYINTDNSALLDLYNDEFTLAYYNNGKLSNNKYTYEEFIGMHPLLYWKDVFGRWIEFKHYEFGAMAEMCKPV
ncbi:hypothetical protein ISS03_01825 [Patescibacteria group bacterium]|nr:hypothetical protein [Patescibacteria group bacterium]